MSHVVKISTKREQRLVQVLGLSYKGIKRVLKKCGKIVLLKLSKVNLNLN